MEPPHLFLGLDLSTQQLKAVVTDDCANVLHDVQVSYDAELPEFKTRHGVHVQPDGLVVTSPVQMWLRAVDLLMEKLKFRGLNFNHIQAISGSGQQHGSVYWKTGALQTLQHLHPNLTLADDLKDCFSVSDCPIWMDSSTQEECLKLEEDVGGPQQLAELTGSRAYHRFTGNQIAKLFKHQPARYHDTERISLVSSFLASIFCGSYAPIDFADGSGMNLLNIRTHSWEQRCLDSCAPELAQKLGTPVASGTVCGRIGNYFVQKYGFNADCSVVTFTGDNPSSLVGMNQQPGDIVVSLGTSDTVFVWLTEPRVSLQSHLLCNPLDQNAFMGMLCYKNGSVTREKVRLSCDCSSWDQFSRLLATTNPGNDGNIGFYWDFPEILPEVPAGIHRFGPDGTDCDSFAPATEARALLEGQSLAKKVHVESLNIGQVKRLLVTGGAAVNKDLLQVLSDVFNCDAYVKEIPNSAALGAAMRASLAVRQTHTASAIAQQDSNAKLAATPNPAAVKVYEAMRERYALLESRIVQRQQRK